MIRLSISILSTIAACNSSFPHRLRSHQPNNVNISPARIDFVTECVAFLSLSDSIQDGVVSQNEFTSFLVSRCISDKMCNGEFDIPFEYLTLDLQLRFIKAVCSHKFIEEKNVCDELERMWLESRVFGFQVIEDVNLSELIEEICTEAYDDAIEMKLVETIAPTPKPSANSTSIEAPINVTSMSLRSLSNSNESKVPTVTATMPLAIFTPTPSNSNLYITQMPSSNKENNIRYPSFMMTNSPSTRPNLAIKPNSFVTECRKTLLSSEFVEDGVISQLEFVLFLLHHCRAEGLCDDDFEMTFEGLDVRLQLNFMLAACGEELEDCIGEPASRNKFGFVVNDEDIEASINKICTGPFAYAMLMGITTTSAPTPATPTDTSTVNTSQIVPLVHNAPSKPSIDFSVEVTPQIDKNHLHTSKSLVGVAAAFAFLFIAAGSVFLYTQSISVQMKNIPNDYYSREVNHYGASVYEWETPLGLPHSTSSRASSSSSLRDYRFLPVYNSDGESIIQFDPNKADAVVIGSVIIGDVGSNSISTRPLVKHESPLKSYITIGQVSTAKNDANSSNPSELSSMTSDHTTSGLGSSECDELFRSSQVSTRSGEKYTLTRFITPNISDNITTSEKCVVRFHNQSFADWSVACELLAEKKDRDQIINSAAVNQQHLFFRPLTSPSSFDISGTSVSSGINPSNNFFPPPTLGPSELPSDGILVPWRKVGRTSAFEPGIMQSKDPNSLRSIDIEHSNGLFSLKHMSDLRALRAIVKRFKSITRSWCKRKQYQNIKELHEDLSVISMRSYASTIQLIPTPNTANVFYLPNLILGTWAAAAAAPPVPNQCKETSYQVQLNTVINSNLNSISSPHIFVMERNLGDISSDIESGIGWSTSSSRHTLCISNCSSASRNGPSVLTGKTTDAGQTFIEKNATRTQFVDVKSRLVKPNLLYSTDTTEYAKKDITHYSPGSTSTKEADGMLGMHPINSTSESA